MRIAINTLPLLRRIAGAEQYTRNIIREIVEQAPAGAQIVLILSKVNADLYERSDSNVQNLVLPVDTRSRVRRILYEQLVLPFVLKKQNIDVLFSPCNIAPLLTFCPKVTMIFDLHWFASFKKLSFWRLLYVRLFIKYSGKFSRSVLTLSESSKSDLLRYLKIPERKISITGIGQTPLMDMRDQVSLAQSEQVLKDLDLPKPYFLFLGQMLFRKNADLVLKALADLRTQGKSLPGLFVLAGGFNEAYQPWKMLTEDLGLEDSVRFINEPSDLQVASLLKNAQFFVYPSRYEGFGIPVMEAMHYGLPVITSPVSSLPEVGGQACLYVSPDSVTEMSKALQEMSSMESLRKDLAQKGLKQSSKFTWQASGQTTMQVLEQSMVK